VIDRWWRIFMLWAIAVASAWLIAALTLRSSYDPRREHPKPTTSLEALSVWDGTAYTAIATDGYPEVSGRLFNFFPLFPAVARAIGGRDNARLGGVIAAQVLALGCLLLMSLMAHGKRAAPLLQEPGLWLLASPFGIFFFAAYTESLFLFLTLLHVAAYDRDRPAISFLAGYLAGLTRPTAIVIPALLGFEALQRWRRQQPWKTTAVLALAPLLGVATFTVGYVGWKTGQLDGYLETSRMFWKHTRVVAFTPYIGVIGEVIGDASRGRIPAFDQLLSVSSTTAILVLLVTGWRRVRASWVAYVIASLLLIHSVRPWGASGRYEAVLFPVFFIVATSRLSRSKLSWVLVALLAAGWMRAMFHFATRRWIG
jgi:hypothetical protein